MSSEIRVHELVEPGSNLRLHSPSVALLPVREMISGHRRLESEAYLTGGYAVGVRILNSRVSHATLSSWAEVKQPGRLRAITVPREHGLPFLAATQVFDIRPTPRKWLAPGRIPELAARYVVPGTILVTRSGSVGECIIAYGSHADAVVSDDLLRVHVRNQDQLGYLYAYLRTDHARSMLRSSQYGSVIKHLEPEHLESIPVIFADDGVYADLNRRITRVFRLRDEAFRLLKDAEEQFTQGVGASDTHEADERAYTVRASEFFTGRRRLDGFHYNPSAEAALLALQKSGRPLEPLRLVVKRVYGVPRFKHVYASTGLPYVDSEDIFKINPEVTKFIPAVTKKDASKYLVHAGWLLVASSGQLYGIAGTAMLAHNWHEDKIVSNHVIRIVPSEHRDAVSAAYLQVALNHPILGRPLVLRLAFGTGVPEISPEDLQDFPVVRLGPDHERSIATAVERATDLRAEADAEENAAVRIVERYLTSLLGPVQDKITASDEDRTNKRSAEG